MCCYQQLTAGTLNVSVVSRGLMKTYQKGGLSFSLLAAAALTVWSQAPTSLQDRIPKADPGKYRAVLDAKDWKNPYLVVVRDGVYIRDVTSHDRPVPPDSVPKILSELPTSAWPYGLVVVVQDAGLLSLGDPPRIKANRERLLRLLKKLSISVERWPS
jgi:hypothetical protein